MLSVIIGVLVCLFLILLINSTLFNQFWETIKIMFAIYKSMNTNNFNSILLILRNNNPHINLDFLIRLVKGLFFNDSNEHISFDTRYDCKEEFLLSRSSREDKKDCFICCKDLNQGDRILRTVCNHVFHDVCLKRWILIKSNCPLCRGVIRYRVLEKTKKKIVDY